MTAGAREVLALAEALERLRSPDVAESYSALAGEPLLLVDLGREAGAVSEDALAAARRALRALPCPSAALAAEPLGKSGRALRDAFDLVLEDAARIETLRARVAASPLASAALVQLLRCGEALDVEGALVAESLTYSMLQAGPEFAAWRAARRPRTPRPEPEGPAVRVVREGDRLRLTLARPEKRNAYSAAMRDALCEGLVLALVDRTLERVVLDGEGVAFCAGGDLDEFGTLPDPATAHAVRTTRSAARLLAACAERVEAQVHGACVGAGAELPAFAHRVVAREDAFFELPELAMGLVPGAGGCASLPRRIGRQRTAWLALSGERLSAERALAWGLVDTLRPA